MRLDHLLSKEERVRAVSLLSYRGGNEEQLVAMRLRGTPVHIPNTMVKTQAAEDTALGTARESRWPPAYQKKN